MDTQFSAYQRVLRMRFQPCFPAPLSPSNVPWVPFGSASNPPLSLSLFKRKPRESEIPAQGPFFCLSGISRFYFHFWGLWEGCLFVHLTCPSPQSSSGQVPFPEGSIRPRLAPRQQYQLESALALASQLRRLPKERGRAAPPVGRVGLWPS